MNRVAGPAHSALGEALVALTGGAIARSRETSWASAGLSGWRHHYQLRMTSPAVDFPIERLGHARFDLPGHVVVDIAAIARAHDAQGSRITIEALTIEED